MSPEEGVREKSLATKHFFTVQSGHLAGANLLPLLGSNSMTQRSQLIKIDSSPLLLLEGQALDRRTGGSELKFG
jgi:hypothetical protein